MTKKWCVGRGHYSNTKNKIEYKRRNPKTNKIVKFIKGKCSICNRNKSQIFTD